MIEAVRAAAERAGEPLLQFRKVNGILSRSRNGLNMAYLLPTKETSSHAQAEFQA